MASKTRTLPLGRPFYTQLDKATWVGKRKRVKIPSGRSHGGMVLQGLLVISVHYTEDKQVM